MSPVQKHFVAIRHPEPGNARAKSIIADAAMIFA